MSYNRLAYSGVFLLLISLIYPACEHDIPELGETIIDGDLEPCVEDGLVHFINDIQPILTSSCAVPGCHDAETPTAQVDLSSYEAVMNTKVREEFIVVPGNAGQSTLYRALRILDIIVPMPPPFNYQITNQQKNLIKRWINEGATNPNPCVNTGCDTTYFTWAEDIRPIINTYCQGCHFGDYSFWRCESGISLASAGICIEWRFNGSN